MNGLYGFIENKFSIIKKIKIEKNQ